MSTGFAAVELAEIVKDSVAVIRVGRQGGGAACVVAPGLLLTNNHVCGKHERLELHFANKSEPISGRVVARCESADLALIAAETQGRQHLKLMDRMEVRTGQLAFAIGHPMGQNYAITAGIVSSAETATSEDGEITLIRSDALLLPGNSGGPLTDARGQILGINTMVFGGDQGLAVHAKHAAELLDSHMNE
jgi:S1-C subfamily serine protease